MQQQEDGSIGGPGFAIKNTDAVDRSVAVVGDHRRCLDGRLCTGGCGRRYGRKKREVRWQGRPTAPDRGSQVRSRLAGGTNRIRTIGPASGKVVDAKFQRSDPGRSNTDFERRSASWTPRDQFVDDSALEGEGFEPSVPVRKDVCKHRDRRRSRAVGAQIGGENLAPLRDQRR